MTETIQLGAISVDVVKKDIKNVHLSVHPPTGRVRISAPTRMKLDTIRVFAISKIDWIKQQQKRMQEQERETPRDYLTRESHYVWGRRYLLKVIEEESAPRVELQHSTMLLQVRPGTPKGRREEIVDGWLRDQLRAAVPALIAKWEPIIGVKVANFFIQRMKTRWGGCNPRARNIRLNSELAKKPRECLEYIVVHEMAHLVHPTHSQSFVELLNRLLPRWGYCREVLNRLPVRHERWEY